MLAIVERVPGCLGDRCKDVGGIARYVHCKGAAGSSPHGIEAAESRQVRFSRPALVNMGLSDVVEKHAV
jgi:hypothetical protein